MASPEEVVAEHRCYRLPRKGKACYSENVPGCEPGAKHPDCTVPVYAIDPATVEGLVLVKADGPAGGC